MLQLVGMAEHNDLSMLIHTQINTNGKLRQLMHTYHRIGGELILQANPHPSE